MPILPRSKIDIIAIIEFYSTFKVSTLIRAEYYKKRQSQMYNHADSNKGK